MEVLHINEWKQVALSTQNVELEITILSIIAASTKSDGTPIIAPNYGAARRQILTRFGRCDLFGPAGRVMSTMRSKGLIVRREGNVWGFTTQAVAQARYKELKRIIDHPSTSKINPSLVETLSGLMAPAAVATV